MLTALLLASTLVAQRPTSFDPDAFRFERTSAGACQLSPLRLELSALGEMGDVGERVAQDSCYTQDRGSEVRSSRASLTVTVTPITGFTLFGEALELSLDTVLIPGDLATGRLDELFVSPAIHLPERWQWAIDDASHVALAVGGAAILTTVLVSLLDK